MMNMVEVSENHKKVTGLVTLATLEKLFKRSSLTIMNWRDRDGLPYVEVPGDLRPAIRYELASVMSWGKKEGKRMHLLKGEGHGEKRYERHPGEALASVED